MSDGEEPLSVHFERFATTVAAKLPLYRRLCLGVVGDDEVLGLLDGRGMHDNPPGLLLAAVHDAVLAEAGAAGGAASALGAWYSSVTDEPRSIGGAGDDPYPAFREVCLTDRRVARSLATKGVQTNEVGRSAALLPAFATVQAAVGRPLALVELGSSGGLNLSFDRYSYDYGDLGSLDPSGGPSPVRLVCGSGGPEPVPVPARMPEVAWRVGVDRSPVDVTDEEAARWLVACVWPDQPWRVARLRAALALVRALPADQRPALVQGDSVDDGLGQLESVPDGAYPCLFATWALSYLGPERQRELVARLDALAAAGLGLSLVFGEQPDVAGGLPFPPRPDRAPDEHRTAFVWLEWSGGRRTDRRLGDLHPHGTWLQWVAA